MTKKYLLMHILLLGVGIMTLLMTAIIHSNENSFGTRYAYAFPSPSPSPVKYVFQDGVSPSIQYSGSKNSIIKEKFPISNFFSSPLLMVDGFDPTAGVLSSLIQWDISAIPKNCSVQNVSLTFSVTNSSVDTYSIFALKKDWKDSEVTWNLANTDQPWEVFGANGEQDRDIRSLGQTLNFSFTGLKTIILNSYGKKIVQSWIKGTAPNYGFVIMKDSDSDDDGIQFHSKNYATPSHRPKLLITCNL